jgi:hypothetical protein
VRHWTHPTRRGKSVGFGLFMNPLPCDVMQLMTEQKKIWQESVSFRNQKHRRSSMTLHNLRVNKGKEDQRHFGLSFLADLCLVY